MLSREKMSLFTRTDLSLSILINFNLTRQKETLCYILVSKIGIAYFLVWVYLSSFVIRHLLFHGFFVKIDGISVARNNCKTWYLLPLTLEFVVNFKWDVTVLTPMHTAMATSRTHQRFGILPRCAKGPREVQSTEHAADWMSPLFRR